MTRMIERWFPCSEVSEMSQTGWGTGNSEKALFTWFAARPLVQARAAVITSLLPWPDDPAEQRRLQDLVRKVMTSREAANAELKQVLTSFYPKGALMIDPFSGRAMFPLEAARLGVRAWGIDYSPVATVGGALLADYPLRDWSAEPQLPFPKWVPNPFQDRLVQDVERVLSEVGSRWNASMEAFYPALRGRQPWGYLWAVTLPCQECSHRFPLVGSLVLRYPNERKADPGQCFDIVADRQAGKFRIDVHSGTPRDNPTRILPPGQSKHSAKGKVGICSFCQHVHPKAVLERLADEGLGEDALLLAADLDEGFGKAFRLPTPEESSAIGVAERALAIEPPFAPGLSATPTEPIPAGNTWTIQPSLFGARTYGDLCNARQTLGFVRLCRVIDQLSMELTLGHLSSDYVAALTGYAGSALVRKVMRSTRGATLQLYRDGRPTGVQNIFGNSESSIAFSYDYFEVGLSDAAGGWASITERTIAAVRNQSERSPGLPARIQRGSALAVPLGSGVADAVVTDPPYDDMIDYTDASDLFYVWLKRALRHSHPEFSITAHEGGVQEKAEEIIVKKGGSSCGDHRTRAFYDRMLAEALTEARRVVSRDGVVTIVFGHGDPEVWHRLLTAIDEAGLVLTGSWPARTEKGGGAGSANIVTTLTMCCRIAPPGRQSGRVSDVDAQVKREIASRIPMWDAAGLALTDQLMASAGPAMEVVGQYCDIRNKQGKPVELDRYLPLARRAVAEAANIKLDSLPLETFDARTRFALFWAGANQRVVMPASEARWQRLASDLTDAETAGILEHTGKGVRLALVEETTQAATEESAVIDVLYATAAKWENEGLGSAAEVLAGSGRSEDPYFWAAVAGLAGFLPEADQDAQTFSALIHNRTPLMSASQSVVAARRREVKKAAQPQLGLFDGGVRND